MYQVKVFSRDTHELIMESDKLPTLKEADKMMKSLGNGEEYYSVAFRLNAVWSNSILRRLRIDN